MKNSCSVKCSIFSYYPFIYMSYIIDLVMLMLQLLTIISSIDDLNYPEKTHTYFIVNAPYIFSACWKVSYYCYQKNKIDVVPYGLVSCMIFLFNIALESVWRPQQDVNTIHYQVVKPLLHERTRRKVQVLSGCGREELLNVRFLFLLLLFSLVS